MEVIMTLDKETKGTVRYGEPGQEEPLIGTLYVPKITLKKMGGQDDAWPQRINVKLEVAK